MDLMCSISALLYLLHLTTLLPFFFFNDTAPTDIYTLSLHDALPIYDQFERHHDVGGLWDIDNPCSPMYESGHMISRSEEHTSELQSPDHLVFRLLLEKKKKT